jgi:lysophospholipase L1-like esterase
LLALRLALLAGSLAASFAAAELLFRALARREYERQVAAWPGDDLVVLARGRPWLYDGKPNATWELATQRDGADVRVVHRTDAAGWRDEPAVPAAPGQRRIMCIGDSYMFGIGVGDAETFPCGLQRELTGRGLAVAVVNRAVPGFNACQEYQLLMHVCERERPDAVVLGFVVNDAEPVPHVPLPPEVLYGRCGSWLWDASKPILNALGTALVGDRRIATRRMLEMDNDYNASFARGDPAGEEAKACVLGMHAVLARRGIPFLVLVFPDFTQPLDDAYGFTLVHERVAEWGSEAGFPVLDLMPTFAGEDHRALWVPGDGHPGPVAQRRMAAAAAGAVAALLR